MNLFVPITYYIKGDHCGALNVQFGSEVQPNINGIPKIDNTPVGTSEVYGLLCL